MSLFQRKGESEVDTVLITGTTSGIGAAFAEKFARERTEPLPAKAGRFGVLLKQPKVVSALCYSFYL